MEQKRTIEILYIFADEDKMLLNELDKHLSNLKRIGLIKTWHKHNVKPGEEWANENEVHLNTAQIILLFISPDFIASDRCYHDMIRAMERHKANEAITVAIILRPVDYKDAPFNDAIIKPDEGEPIISR